MLELKLNFDPVLSIPLEGVVFFLTGQGQTGKKGVRHFSQTLNNMDTKDQRGNVGRNKLDEDKKRKGVYIKLPLWLKEWLKEQPISQGMTVEKALIKAHKLKEPKIK